MLYGKTSNTIKCVLYYSEERYNVTFDLSLTDLVNIYSVYHDLTNLLQEVIIIPFDQIEKF